METHLVLCLFIRRLANAGYPQAPYLGAFQSLNATSCRKRSASIARFPPRCRSHHKNKVISYTHPGNPDQRTEGQWEVQPHHNMYCMHRFSHKRDNEGSIGCITKVYDIWRNMKCSQSSIAHGKQLTRHSSTMDYADWPLIKHARDKNQNQI